MTVIAWHYLVPGIILFLFSHCKKKELSRMASPPKLATTAVTNITTSSATTGGTITRNVGPAVTASGICWSRTKSSV